VFFEGGAKMGRAAKEEIKGDYFGRGIQGGGNLLDRRLDPELLQEGVGCRMEILLEVTFQFTRRTSEECSQRFNVEFAVPADSRPGFRFQVRPWMDSHTNTGVKGGVPGT
jgi:hypothetical protein